MAAFSEALRDAQVKQTRGLVHDLLNPVSIILIHAQAILNVIRDLIVNGLDFQM